MPAIHIEPSWKEILKEEFTSEYFIKLTSFLRDEKAGGKIIYPPGDRIFSAFDLTPFDAVKVVIIGQDPYHGAGQANGLSFSVADGVRKPPSLLNIFREIERDLGIPVPVSGNLEAWARQGVLLLNATLTVRAGEPGSHQGRGWEPFTDAVIAALSQRREGIIFLLWGRFAQAKAILIDAKRHFILTAAHPSPLARTGFAGCRHFSQANEILTRSKQGAVNWNTTA